MMGAERGWGIVCEDDGQNVAICGCWETGGPN